MRSRAQVAFRPGTDCPGGLDWLECRRLLSAVVASVETVAALAASDGAAKDTSQAETSAAASSTAPAATTATAADPSSQAETSAAASSTAPAATTATAADPSSESSDGAISPTAGASSVGENGFVDEPDRLTALVSPVNASGSASGALATPAFDTAEQTTGEEPTSGPTADPSAPDQSALGVVGAPGGTADGPNPDASPAQASPSPSGGATGAGTAAHPANDGAQAYAVESDGSLLADAAPAAGSGLASAAPGATSHDSEGPGGDIVDEGDAATTGSATESSSSSAEPSPRCADLLTEFLPFDRAALDQAIDRFLSPLEDLRAELAAWQPPAGLISATAIVAGAALAAEVVRRRAGGNAPAVVAIAATPRSGDELVRFPGYPWAWSIRNS